jgi:hypothetical protein
MILNRTNLEKIEKSNLNRSASFSLVEHQDYDLVAIELPSLQLQISLQEWRSLDFNAKSP